MPSIRFLQPRGTGSPDNIVVTAAKIDQLGSVFAKTWQRPPNADELKGLIDDYVKEEIYVREALALGLDQDDTVIRRRLHLKMEFMSDAGAGLPVPMDADLEAYLETHAAEFEVDPLVAFRQIFLSPERRGDKIDEDATAILESLRTDASMDPATLGDATLLPYEQPLTSKSSIGQAFGPEFAEAIYRLEPGQWTVRSSRILGFTSSMCRSARQDASRRSAKYAPLSRGNGPAPGARNSKMIASTNFSSGIT